METKIKKQEHNPMLLREEVEIIVGSAKTPSNAEAKEIVASKLNKAAELVVVNGIHRKFGHAESEISAYVYKDAESLVKVQPKPKVKKTAAAPAPAK